MLGPVNSAYCQMPVPLSRWYFSEYLEPLFGGTRWDQQIIFNMFTVKYYSTAVCPGLKQSFPPREMTVTVLAEASLKPSYVSPGLCWHPTTRTGFLHQQSCYCFGRLSTAGAIPSFPQLSFQTRPETSDHMSPRRAVGSRDLNHLQAGGSKNALTSPATDDQEACAHDC
jgi:hypothetical protein